MRKDEQRLQIKDGYSLEDGRLIIPENAQWKILKDLHQFSFGCREYLPDGFSFV